MRGGAQLARWDWLVWLIASGGMLALAAALEFHPPRGVVVPGFQLHLPQICSTQRMFGIDCPGCGLTRSFVLAADGQLAGAAATHPVGVLFFVLLVLQIPWRVWQGWQVLHNRRVADTGWLEMRIGAALLVASFLWWMTKAVGTF